MTGRHRELDEVESSMELDPLPGSSCRLYTTALLASLARVHPSTIRGWHRRELLKATPAGGGALLFDFRQLVVARQLAGLVQQGISIQRIQRQLSRLRQRHPGIALADYKVEIDGGWLRLRKDGEALDASGQRLLDFEALDRDDDPEPVERVPFTSMPRSQQVPGPPSQGPEELDQLADELESAGEISEAIRAVRMALLAGGPDAARCFRLGELLYLDGDPAGARERYFAALEIDSALIDARVSLGVILHELGETDLGIATLQGALQDQPDYPDAHFHLAEALESALRRDEAREHWQAFLELAPAGPWSDQARLRLETVN